MTLALVDIILRGLGGLTLLVVALLLLVYFTQERAAGVGKWAANFFRFCGKAIRLLTTRSARRRVQRKLNKVIAKGSAERPFLNCKVKLEWARADATREQFFRERHFIVTVPRDFDRDQVLIDALYLFVARTLLARVKRFLSDNQRTAIDIYYTTRLLEATSENLTYEFISEYVPESLDASVTAYLHTFDSLERHALFEDVFIRELSRVGGKLAPVSQVFEISQDTDALLDILTTVSRRQSAQEIDTTLERSYIRTGMVMIGKREKLDGPEPWVDYIRGALLPRQIDSVYLLSEVSKQTIVDAVARRMQSDYVIERSLQRSAVLLQRTQEVYMVQLVSKHESALTVHRNGVKSSRELSGAVDPAKVIDIRSNRSKVMGTIKFITPDGWGFIDLDDPSLGDAWFDEEQIERRPAVVGTGDRIECRVHRDERGRYTASDIRVLLSGHGGAGVGRTVSIDTAMPTDQPSGPSAPRRARSATTAVESHSSIEDNFERLSGVVVDLVVDLDRERQGKPAALAVFGARLHDRLPDFDLRDYGQPSLLSLVTAMADADPRLWVDRFDNGHPFIALSSSRGPEPEVEAPPL